MISTDIDKFTQRRVEKRDFSFTLILVEVYFLFNLIKKRLGFLYAYQRDFFYVHVSVPLCNCLINYSGGIQIGVSERSITWMRIMVRQSYLHKNCFECDNSIDLTIPCRRTPLPERNTS